MEQINSSPQTFKSKVIKDVTTELGDANYFGKARREELNWLMDRGVSPVRKSMANGHRLYGGRFMDELKHFGTKSQTAKSRLLIQAIADKGHGFLTHAPTVSNYRKGF